MPENQNAVIKLNKSQSETESKIDAIKNLIFGDNIQAYDSEFESLRKDILEKKKVLEKLIDEVKTDLNGAIDSVATDVNIRITELEDKLNDKIENLSEGQVSKKMLGDLLIDLGKKVNRK